MTAKPASAPPASPPAELASIAAHELSAPLRVVAGYAGMLAEREGVRADPGAVELLRSLESGVERMQALIDSLRDYARLEQAELVAEPVDCDELVRERVLPDLAEAIEATGAELAIEPLPTVHGDPTQLAQLLRNLLSNALKFVAPGRRPEVRVWAERGEGVWQFHVRDNGVGIEPRDTLRIFQMLGRARTHRDFPGSGVGLALAERVVARHGGHIWVDSAPGEGSTFRFTIPIEMRRSTDPRPLAPASAPAGAEGA